MEDAPVLCPACRTPWDFKQTPCRTCKKIVNWTKYQESAHKKARDLKIMLARKAKLAKIRKKKKDKEEQRKLDVALKIAKQKADALKWQKDRLLMQRQEKKRMRDIKNGIIKEDGKKDTNIASKAINLLSMAGQKKNTNENKIKKNTLPGTTATITTKGEKKGEVLVESESSDDELDIESDVVDRSSKNVYVEAQPAGYSFPLLSTFAERDLGMRVERMKNPNIMTSEETLLRTLDQLTKNEITSNGKRNRSNNVSKNRKLMKKNFEKRLYMYGLDHIKRKPKYPDAVGNKDVVFKQKVIPKKKTWVDIHGITKVKDVEKAEHFLEQLHAEQVKETLRAQEIAKVQANGDHRRQLKLYTLMKGAESQDKMIDLMEDAGMLSMPQLIEHVQKSVQLDHIIQEQMKAQNV